MLPKTDAIVLKTFDFRETSRIITFFTKDYGKVKGLLKGIRKDPRKFGSHVDKCSLNEIIYYPSRRSELHLVSHCDLKQDFLNIRKDYRRNMAATYMLELVDAIMPVEEKNLSVYQLMSDYLQSLETISDIARLVYIFQIKILLFSGFRPHVDACVKCEKQIHGKARFSMRSGGLICADCPTSEMSFTLISPGTIASMLHIEEGDWQECLRLGLTNMAKKELKYVLNNFLLYHLERELKTTKYLQEELVGRDV